MIDLAKINQEKVLTGNDNIVIRKYIDGIEGGRDLDMTAYKATTGSTILGAGHVIIKTTSNGVTTYKPMPVVQKTETTGSGNDAVTTNVTDADGNPVYEYDSLPANHSYAGILVASIDAATNGAAIMTRGKVNKSDDVMPYSITSILTALKAALPLIEFMEDAD